ncbi:DUF2200 domain-containing protein [Candidatus Gracilibacteria bacterium]|nr:DUF2200 domain-containing protein [Candidatus Gracilibacteria bacterium]
MQNQEQHDIRMAEMKFSTVYPHYVTKVTKKGRSVEELHQVIYWLTGYSEDDIENCIRQDISFEDFFKHATLHPNSDKITGLICGYRIEEIQNPLTQKVRYLDKLVDELAKGRKMEKILRT